MMDTNLMIVIIAAIFAIVIIVGFIIFRKKVKVDLQLPGSKLDFEGSNEVSTQKKSLPTEKHGIFNNWSIGRTKIEVQGKETVADNVSVGDTKYKSKE